MGNWRRTLCAAIAITTVASLMPEVASGAAPGSPAPESSTYFISNVSAPVPRYAPAGWIARYVRYLRYMRLMREVPTPDVNWVKRDINVHLVRSMDEWHEPPERRWYEPEPSWIEKYLDREQQKRKACRALVGTLWAPVREELPGGAGRQQVMEVTDELIREHLLSSLTEESQDHLARLLMEQATKYTPLNPWRNIIRDSKDAICGP